MEATRLAPAGRACSKFVWHSRFLMNWAVRVLAIRAALPFVTITHRRRRLRITGARGVRWDLIDSISAIRRRSAGCDSDLRLGNALRLALRFAPSGSLQIGGRFPLPRAGHVVAAIGRHPSRPKCGGRRDGCLANRRPRGAQRRAALCPAGGRRNSLANSKRSGINSAQRA
jgi:hypothetical protein